MAFNGEGLFILLSEKLPCLSRCIGFQNASKLVNTYQCLFLLLRFQGYSKRLSRVNHTIARDIVGGGRCFSAQHRHPL